MIDCAYVQRKNGDWLNENAYNLVYGLRMLGVEVKPFNFKDLEDLPLTKGTMVHGGIYTVRRALERLGCAPPDVCGGLPPSELMPFYGRKVWAATMLDIRRRLETDEPVFVKPLRSQKAFNGHVTSGELRDLIQTAAFDDDFEVLCSEPVQFVTEYRSFVNRGEVIGMKHYKGDFGRIVDFDVVKAGAKAWNGPISHSIDWGLDVHGRTIIVEINDGFALGSYGFASIPYANFVMDRWEQMTGSIP